MNPLIQLKSRTLVFLVTVVLACFALSPQVRAQCRQGCDANTGNTFLGHAALHSNTTGFSNTAIGIAALYSNTTGDYNTAIGDIALNTNTTGSYNTATGVFALGGSGVEGANIGSGNTANGFSALSNNTSGYENTAIGNQVLEFNTTGGNNTAVGSIALFINTTGSGNTATGDAALLANNGDKNTADGSQALQNNTTGSFNIAVGSQAGSNLTTGSNNIDIGNVGVAGDAGKIRIGTANTHNATFVAGIYNVNEGGTIKPVYINNNGRLGTQPPASARKFKEEIKAMEKSSEGILKLKPVTFRYKNDAERTPQFGLVAEEVANVNPDLVMRDENGEIYTVRYDAVNAMLLNEFLKEHRKVEKLETTIAQQRKDFETAIAQVKAQVQKVSAQLESSKPAPQVVNNP